ncbi:NADH-quinone oxidoreductase subunit C [Streptomyces sp. NPDC090499]|uniref:NADH-quinone oxidoreductase subunit C n=1 Tax=Streptomyces sp. NPDC090499 TaxID=3365965 RepID=UPI0037F5D0DA
MTAPAGWLPAPVEELFGTDARADESYDVLTVDVPPSSWLAALEIARTTLSCTYFDWLSAVDEPGTGFRVSAHVVALAPVRRLLLRTTVPHTDPELPSAVGVYAGARWHERETHEMFGVRFTGHPGLDHLLLPETFEGHPLRKDFVLAARVAKAWPGAKEPGESDHGGPRRRQMLPPGVPDPNEWGPLKGQLPAAPARPARTAAGRAAGDRPPRPARETDDGPVRRSRTAAEGSASQATSAAAAAESTGAAEPTGAVESTEAPGAARPTATPRRARSASGGSASQRATSGAEGAPTGNGVAEGTGAEATAAEGAAAATGPSAAPRGPRRARIASGGSSSQRAQETEPGTPAAPATPGRPATHRSSDAPWHHARPAFDETADGGSAAETSAAPPEAAGAPGTEAQEPGAGEPNTSTAPTAEPTAPEPTGPEPTGPEPAASGSAESSPAAAEEPEELEPNAAEAPAPAPAPERIAEAPTPDDTAPERPAHPDDPSGGPQ